MATRTLIYFWLLANTLIGIIVISFLRLFPLDDSLSPPFDAPYSFVLTLEVSYQLKRTVTRCPNKLFDIGPRID